MATVKKQSHSRPINFDVKPNYDDLVKSMLMKDQMLKMNATYHEDAAHENSTINECIKPANRVSLTIGDINNKGK